MASARRADQAPSRKTKIVATIGPASAAAATLRALVGAGVSAFRLNLSHDSLPVHLDRIDRIRKLRKSLGLPLPILADLPGPKIRLGPLPDDPPRLLREGERCTLSPAGAGGTDRIPVAYRGLSRLVRPGQPILLADGAIELEVRKVSGDDVHCIALTGGEIRGRAGVNLPGLPVPIPALTRRDRALLAQVARAGIDYVALSFVQAADDIRVARRALDRLGASIPLIAKIEKPRAVQSIHEILAEADGIMIARGDLGVELPAARIPAVQKDLIREAVQRAVPVITATQMLDSMIRRPRPTRAETTDVANAIWDGTDAVMLSGETAIGRYPVQTVSMMAEIIDEAEARPSLRASIGREVAGDADEELILLAARTIAERKGQRAIVTYTRSGATAARLSSLRPELPIFALTPHATTLQRLGLVWGVRPLLVSRERTVESLIRSGDRVLTRNTPLERGDPVLVIAGTRLTHGATNLIKIHRIGTAFTPRI